MTNPIFKLKDMPQRDKNIKIPCGVCRKKPSLFIVEKQYFIDEDYWRGGVRYICSKTCYMVFMWSGS